MVIEFFRTTEQRHIEDAYALSVFNGMINGATNSAARLAKLGQYDELIIANAPILSSDPVNFICMVNQLLSAGVKIHFVEEAVVLSPRTQGITAEFTNQILRLIASCTGSSQSVSKDAQQSLLPKGTAPIDSSLLTKRALKH